MREFDLLQSLPLAKSWEGATNGISQKTYLEALDRLYLQDTGKNQNLFLSLFFFAIKGICRSAIAVLISLH